MPRKELKKLAGINIQKSTVRSKLHVPLVIVSKKMSVDTQKLVLKLGTFLSTNNTKHVSEF